MPAPAGGSIPLHHRAAVGRPTGRRGGAAQRDRGASGRSASARSRPYLGLPSIHDPDNYWDPFFAACDETSTIVNMHIGSSSKMPSTSADAPPAVGSSLTHINAELSMADFLLSGLFERFANLKVAYSEGQIGWIPHLLAPDGRGVGGEPGLGRGGRQGPEPALELLRGPRLRLLLRRRPTDCCSVDEIGEDNITYESDYPHSDSTLAPHPGDRREADGAA